MKRAEFIFLSIVLMSWVSPVLASEYGMEKEKEALGSSQDPVTQISNDDIKKFMEEYIKEHSIETGTFDIFDEESKITRRLTLDNIQDKVTKTGNHYLAYINFKDTESNDTFEVDVDIEDINGDLRVDDIKIHTVNGVERHLTAQASATTETKKNEAVATSGSGTEEKMNQTKETETQHQTISPAESDQPGPLSPEASEIPTVTTGHGVNY